MKKYRDLSILQVDEQKTMVISCDSCGAVGTKPGDVLQASPELTGELTARVALMEVMCTGAKIQCLYNALSCEMQPTGEQIIKGIRSELKKAGIDPELMSGSTEENFPTCMTAIGIVAIGMSEGNLRVGGVTAGDCAVLIATPKYGDKIKQPVDLDIVSYEEICTILEIKGVKEIVPCGSKGVLYEAKAIAEFNNVRFVATNDDSDLLTASAGPATCAVVAIKHEDLEMLTDKIGQNRMQILGDYES